MGRVHAAEAGEFAGNRGAERPGDGDAVAEAFGRCRLRGGAGGVEDLGDAALGHEHVEEAVAAQAGHHRLAYAQGERGGDRGIHRIAAGPQRIQPGLGRHGVVGADGAVAAHDQRAVAAW